MPNDFSNKDNSSLILTAGTFVQAAEGDPAYGLPPATYAALTSEADALTNVGLQYAQTEAILKGLTDQKAAARSALVARLGATAKTLEANPAVTDAMLRTAGLAARPAKGVRPTSLDAPANLMAQGFSDGSLALKWIRTNRARTGFVVETSADGLGWTYLGTTMRTTLRAKGFAPGQPVYVRVTAVNSDLCSEPSNVASVYAPASVLEVKQAA